MSDGSSEWREDDENASEEKDRKRKHESNSNRRQDQKQQSSSRSRMPRSRIMDGLDSRDAKQVEFLNSQTYSIYYVY